MVTSGALSKLAASGVAQYNLALGYRDGLGVPQSQRMAVKWLRVSEAACNPEGQNDLGYCLHEGLGVGKDRAPAFRWYFRAAKQGVLRAQFMLVFAIAMAMASSPATRRLASGFRRLLAADMLRRVRP
jgi:TPR repeat protein